MMRFLRCDSQSDADALSQELWAYSRPIRDPRDVTTHALQVVLDGSDWGLVLPDDFMLRKALGHTPATVEMEKIATRGAATTLVGRATITMNNLAALAPARVRTP